MLESIKNYFSYRERIKRSFKRSDKKQEKNIKKMNASVDAFIVVLHKKFD